MNALLNVQLAEVPVQQESDGFSTKPQRSIEQRAAFKDLSFRFSEREQAFQRHNRWVLVMIQLFHDSSLNLLLWGNAPPQRARGM